MALKHRIGRVLFHDNDFRDSLTPRQIARKLHVKVSTVRGRISEMVKRGELYRDHSGFVITTLATPCTCDRG